MSLLSELYTKRQYFDDLAKCAEILHIAREGVVDGQISGLRLIQLERETALDVKRAKERWAENGRWFGALAKAKRDWARKVFGEHDHESLKRLAFLKAIVAKILEGAPTATIQRVIAMPEGAGPWCRERLSRDVHRSFMPECDYEICTGGRWMPVQKQDLPNKVRWV